MNKLNSSIPLERIEITFLPYEEGLRILNLSDEEVENIGNKLSNFFHKINKKRNRNIDRNPVTMLKGAIFAVGSARLKNIEWKEHCSSSLREIFHVWKSGQLGSFKNDYRDCYNKNIDQDTNYTLEKIWNYYELFSGIDHHEHDKWRWALIIIKQDSTIKHTRGLGDDEFIELLKEFFTLLKKVFY